MTRSPVELPTVQAGGGGALGVLLRAGLAPAAFVYGAAVRVRNALYDRGWRRVVRAPRRVVSVGNLTAGGTGKTPMVAWLARALLAAGRRPGVLSRGYGPRPPDATRSDEGEVLAEVLGEGVPIVEDPSRVRGAARLLALHPEVDVLLLDDGFQHRALARDVDVVLIDATFPFGHGRLLPRGMLREPVQGLRRAHAVVLTKTEAVDEAVLRALRDEVRRLAPGATLAVAATRPTVLRFGDGTTASPSALEGVAVLAFSGIARPEGFERTLERLGARVVARRRARDHAPHDAADLAAAREAAARAGARYVVVTQKDAVKLRPLGVPTDVPPEVVALEIAAELVEGAQELVRLACGPT